MDGQRSIVFHNDSGRDGDYALFMAFPHIHCEDNGAMHTAAWISRYVPDGAHEQIDVDDEIYAWHATQDGSFDLGAVIEEGTSSPVVLGTKKAHGSSFSTTLRRGENKLVPQPNAAPNEQFEIHAQPRPSGQELIGVGKRGDDGSVVPVVALQATPSFSYGISPQARLYMARFDNGIRVGELVDLRARWKKACIDFSSRSARGHAQAIVTAKETGRFEVSYRDPVPAKPSLQRILSTTPSVGALARQGVDRWSGSISWPDTSSTTAVIQGSGMVIEALGSKYRWSVNTSQTDNGGVRMKVSFWLGEGRQPDYLYEQDWKNAVRGLGDQKEVELMDLGCFPTTPYGSFSRLPVFSR
ncbi:hypothetical protein MKZ38_009850 [Zalerion maritima]|uniref:Uncharacterized protein n=1 Tax=Zalerion maritima TaxID=339359 RepID=A0AAD5RGN1_9PEZI|nr:hypothetical protein MKZ38_009850 [Zalerion maritima]